MHHCLTAHILPGCPTDIHLFLKKSLHREIWEMQTQECDKYVFPLPCSGRRPQQKKKKKKEAFLAVLLKQGSSEAREMGCEVGV